MFVCSSFVGVVAWLIMDFAQLMSAQTLPALFQLRKFYSIASLIFKCFVSHVFLELIFTEANENFGRPSFFQPFSFLFDVLCF